MLDGYVLSTGFELNAADCRNLSHGTQEGTDGLTLHLVTLTGPIALLNVGYRAPKTPLKYAGPAKNLGYSRAACEIATILSHTRVVSPNIPGPRRLLCALLCTYSSTAGNGPKHPKRVPHRRTHSSL
jgi:hypothetical protein